MKPDFALDFRNNQISLLHRADGVWATIGRVAMDDPDLDAAMGYLRTTALGLSPRGIATKLILPNEAILYTRLDDLPFDAAKRAQRIAAGLVGRTPYDVADLVFDWTDAGDAAHLAVIARETLAEAEGFASQHRFNPIAFVALPDQGGYEGEVWFGPTQLSETLLAKGEVVERDDVTVFAPLADVAAAAPLAASDFEMGAAAADVAAPVGDRPEDAAPMSAVLPDADSAPQAASGVAEDHLAETGEVAETGDVAEAGDGHVADDAPDAATGDDKRAHWQDFVVEDEAAPAPSQPDLFAPDDGGDGLAREKSPADFDAVMTSLAAEDNADQAADAPSDEEAPMAVDVPLLDEASATATTAAVDAAEKKPTKAEALLAAFAARRAAAQAKSAAGERAEPQSEPDLPAPAAAGAGAAVDLALLDDVVVLPAVPHAPKLGGAAADLGAAPPIAAHPLAAPSIAAPSIAAPPISAPSIARPPVVKHVPAKTPPNKGQNLKSMPAAKARGGVKLGWVLTIALLVALAAAAALSTYLLEAANRLLPITTAVASLPAAAPPSTDAAAAPAPITQQPAGVLTLSTRAAQPAVAAPELSVTARPAPRPAAPTQDLALPAASAPPQPAAVAAPPTVVVSITQGKPSLVPAPRPQVVLDAAALLAAANPAPDLPAAAPPVFADPALASARPLARPEAVLAAAKALLPKPAPAPATGPSELAINANPALQGARPLPRPAGVEDLARAAQLASAPASLVASAALNAAENALLAGTPTPLARPDPNRSKLAVAISPTPSARPKGLKAAFEAQQAAAAARAAEAEAEALAAAAAAAAAPAEAPKAAASASEDVATLEAEVEEEVTRSNGGATRSIVAKQATVKNVLNLSEANLVGIFGSKSNRYALIRQPSGMFKKVKVGDRFNGGRVAAITESELRYDKGGELVALTMPRG